MIRLTKQLLFCFTISFCIALNVRAQNIILEGKVIDGKSASQLPATNIDLVSLQDTSTYSAISGPDGRFRIIKVSTFGKFLLSAHRFGFATFAKVIQINNPVEDIGNVIMLDSLHLMKETIVKSRHKAFRVKGDTLEYTSSYYRTNPDLDAVYLINKMPGIDLYNMTANGDTITKILLNGIVIFSDRPLKILSQIPAGYIDKVQVFSDNVDTNRLSSAEINRSKVISIKTTDNYITRPKGKVYGGYASDDYFIAGLNLIEQKKTTQLAIDGSINRGKINYNSYYDPTYQFEANGVPLISELHATLTSPISKRDQLNLSYTFYGLSNYLDRETFYEYGLDAGASHVTSHYTSQIRSLSNSLRLKWTRILKPNKTVTFSSLLNINNTKSNDSSNVQTIINQDSINSYSTTNPDFTRTIYTGTVSFVNKTSKNANFEIRGIYGLSYFNQKAGIQAFNSSKDTNYTSNVLDNIFRNTNRFALMLEGRLLASKVRSFEYSFSSEYTVNEAKQDRYLYSNLSHSYSIADAPFINRANYTTLNDNFHLKEILNLTKPNVNMELGLDIKHYMITSVNFPDLNPYFTLNPFLSISKKFSALKELNINIEKTSEFPTYDNINPVINAADNYFFNVGNIHIQPTARYNFNISYKSKFAFPESVFNTRGSLIYIPNNITDCLVIPSDTAVLFNSTFIPIGAQLSYYLNANDYRYGLYSLEIDVPLNSIKTVMKLSTNIQGRSTTSYINFQPVITKNLDYVANVTLNSIFSTKLDIVLFAGYDFNRSAQDANGSISRNLNQFKISSLFTGQITKKQTLKIESNLNYASGLSSDKRTQFYLVNLSYQYKLLHNNKLNITMTLHDAFKSYTNYTYEYRDNAIYSSFTNGIGRYLLLIIGYNF